MATNIVSRIKWLADAVDKILAEAPPEQRSIYAAALRDALQIDTENSGKSPKCASPESIWNDHGINPQTQLDFHIALTRSQGVEFLQSIGIHVTLAKFQKQSSSDKYKSKFRRDISKGRGFILTYAEILHLVDHLVPLPFPDRLWDYLED